MQKIDFSKLTETDTYSLILFILYKLKDIPSYAVISQLIYLFDKETVLSLCQSFGGQTIEIPKISDLNLVVQALNKYYHEDIKKDISIEIEDNSIYNVIKEMLSGYNFE